MGQGFSQSINRHFNQSAQTENSLTDQPTLLGAGHEVVDG